MWRTEATKLVRVVFQCSRRECEEPFIAYYEGDASPGHALLYKLTATRPKNPTPETFPAEISAISPNFIAIYNEAAAVQALGFGEIAGVGYRKSLEFLIKDYLIALNPTERTKYETTALGNCIKDHVSDPNVKIAAERATWIGNDETHYVRKWATKDIEDLKRLIKLTVNWIHSAELTKAYRSSMP